MIQVYIDYIKLLSWQPQVQGSFVMPEIVIYR